MTLLTNNQSAPILSPISFINNGEDDNLPESSLTTKILKIALSIFVAAGCLLQRKNLTLFIENAFRAFLGFKGPMISALMGATYSGLKLIVLSNQPSDNQVPPPPITTRVFNWLEKIPTDFEIGVSKLPKSLILKISTAILTSLIFKSLSINTESTLNLKGINCFSLAIRGPFLEELFFREFLQSSLTSIMKIMNLAASHMGMREIIAPETISQSSRIFSAATFGLIHSNQSFVQATTAGIESYFYETKLYEKHGLFASFGLHSANNFFCWCLLQFAKSLK